MRNALATQALEGELQRVKRSRDGTLTFADIITRTEAMRPVLRAAEKAAASTIPVLIEGESGVGKELIARAIHGSGARRAKPFVAVNCGAIPENLVESILFGHEKGAFTGATEKHIGKFVEADGGTLFLDEVGELPPAAQVKLLRALQEDEVEPVGARKTVKVDVRIISATNRDLIADVKAGRFREDLFYRLHVFPISVPPLRRRRGHPRTRPPFPRPLRRRGRQAPARDRAGGAGAADRLPLAGQCAPVGKRDFPRGGAGRRRALGVDEFPQICRPARRPMPRSRFDPSPAIAAAWPDAREAAEFAAQNAAPLTTASLRLIDAHGDVRPLEDIEREVIRFAIAHYREQMSEVARRLKIGRSTLYRKLEGLGLDEGRAKREAENAAAELVNGAALTMRRAALAVIESNRKQAAIFIRRLPFPPHNACNAHRVRAG